MSTNLQRDEALCALASMSTPEVLIIGGGINRVGVFRDLAFQRVSVALVTKGDFAEGATRSPFWVQLFADSLGLPIEIPLTLV